MADDYIGVSFSTLREAAGELEDIQVVTTGHANYAEAHRAVLRGWGAA